MLTLSLPEFSCLSKLRGGDPVAAANAALALLRIAHADPSSHMRIAVHALPTVLRGGMYQKFGAAPIVTVTVAAARPSADVSRLALAEASDSYCAVAAWTASESMVVRVLAG